MQTTRQHELPEAWLLTRTKKMTTVTIMTTVKIITIMRARTLTTNHDNDIDNDNDFENYALQSGPAVEHLLQKGSALRCLLASCLLASSLKLLSSLLLLLSLFLLSFMLSLSNSQSKAPAFPAIAHWCPARQLGRTV